MSAEGIPCPWDAGVRPASLRPRVRGRCHPWVEPGVIGVKGVTELMPADGLSKLHARGSGSRRKRQHRGIRQEVTMGAVNSANPEVVPAMKMRREILR